MRGRVWSSMPCHAMSFRPVHVTRAAQPRPETMSGRRRSRANVTMWLIRWVLAAVGKARRHKRAGLLLWQTRKQAIAGTSNSDHLGCRSSARWSTWTNTANGSCPLTVSCRVCSGGQREPRAITETKTGLISVFVCQAPESWNERAQTKHRDEKYGIITV
jgi:hypothetical protein